MFHAFGKGVQSPFSLTFCFSVKTHFVPRISRPLALERSSTFQALYSNREDNSYWIPSIRKFASGGVMAYSNDEGIVFCRCGLKSLNLFICIVGLPPTSWWFADPTRSQDCGRIRMFWSHVSWSSDSFNYVTLLWIWGFLMNTITFNSLIFPVSFISLIWSLVDSDVVLVSNDISDTVSCLPKFDSIVATSFRPFIWQKLSSLVVLTYLLRNRLESNKLGFQKAWKNWNSISLQINPHVEQ